MFKLNFEVKEEETKPDYGRFVISPLARGYGHTLGNALRRVLISSLKGAAATSVKIKGVQHRFSTLKGLKEDILELLLNIKQIKFKLSGVDEAKLKLSKSGPGEVKVSDIELPAGVEVMNKDFVLGTLADKKAKLEMEIKVESGYGYSPFEERNTDKIGVLPVDAIFSPVQQVNYKVEETRVGRVTNLDRLTLEVWTDSAIKPKDAVAQAADILSQAFLNIYGPKRKKLKKEANGSKEKSIEDAGLKVRVVNALKREEILTIQQLSTLSKKDLMQIKNLGQRSIQEIKKVLNEYDLSLKKDV